MKMVNKISLIGCCDRKLSMCVCVGLSQRFMLEYSNFVYIFQFQALFLGASKYLLTTSHDRVSMVSFVRFFR